MNQDTPDQEVSSGNRRESLAVTAISAPYKVLGELTAANGVGVVGQNNATSGTPIGVEGAVPNSSDGYGLATSDDAKIAGILDTTGTDFVVETGTQATQDARNVVQGHASNRVTDGAVGAVVGGGGYDDGSTIRPNLVHDEYCTIDGGVDNKAGSNSDADPTTARYGTVGGGSGNTASGRESTVGGGGDNTASGHRSIVGGGGEKNTAGASRATAAGGESNIVTSGSTYATVGGGLLNRANGSFSTIAGGGPSDLFDLKGTRNVVYDKYGTIGGGGNNQAGRDDGDRTNHEFATVAGGRSNAAKASRSTIGGGDANTISPAGKKAVIGGGVGNSVEAGNGTVGGGADNLASGLFATVPGGSSNVASANSSFAAGLFAEAADDQAFVWNDGSGASDSTGSDSDRFSSSTADGTSGVTGAGTFHVKATGGVRMITDGSNSKVTYIAGGTAGWSSTSTRTEKTNVEPADPEKALIGVNSMPVSTWEYVDENGQGEGTRHIGPMAVDFHDAFDVGDSDTAINSINADGVAFAAIQGLSEKLAEARTTISEQKETITDLEAENQQLGDRIAELGAENEQLRERVAAVENRVASLEAGQSTSVQADD